MTDDPEADADPTAYAGEGGDSGGGGATVSWDGPATPDEAAAQGGGRNDGEDLPLVVDPFAGGGGARQEGYASSSRAEPAHEARHDAAPAGHETSGPAY